MTDDNEKMTCHSLLQEIGACVFLRATASTLNERLAFEKREAALVNQLDARCDRLAGQLASKLAKSQGREGLKREALER